MTHNDLVEKLRAMLATATHGDDVTATVLLFGILFDAEIRNSGSNGTRIGEATGKQYGPMVTDGQKLARLGFVQPSVDSVRKWKTPTCSTCKYSATGSKPERLQCRRHAPTARLLGPPQNYLPRVEWPEVSANAWCGDWLARSD